MAKADLFNQKCVKTHRKKKKKGNKQVSDLTKSPGGQKSLPWLK